MASAPAAGTAVSGAAATALLGFMQGTHSKPSYYNNQRQYNYISYGHIRIPFLAF